MSMNTTLNRLGLGSPLGEQLQGIFISETKKRRTCWCTKAILWELTHFLCQHFRWFMLYNLRTEI